MHERQRHRPLIVDDHPLVRRGLSEVLTDTGDFQVVAAVPGPEEACRGRLLPHEGA